MDMTISGSIYITGILNMVGGAGTFIQDPLNPSIDEALMITGWGLSEGGRRWFNPDLEQFVGWNGIELVLLG